MVILNDLDIKITRGDTATFNVAFDGDIPIDGTICVFSVKVNEWAKVPVIEKTLIVENGEVEFTLDAEDTVNMAFGTYHWDLRLFYGDPITEVVTPFGPAKFIVMGAIGNDK